MIVKFFNRLQAFYRQIIGSIGFWPSIITLAYGSIAALLLWLDTNKITTFLLENTPALVIKDGDTARVILSTVVGGLVSLTVFSFTMVMAQLNRAATSYSPRLLPGLISSKRHQIVLGTFLGSISFCLIVLITIEPSDDSYELPGLAILISVILAIGSLGTFVYFIHSISQDIQVTRILERVARETVNRMAALESLDERNQHSKTPDVDLPVTVRSQTTGYFHGVNKQTLKGLAAKNDLLIEVMPVQGEFVLENTMIVRLSKEVEKELTEEMVSCFRFTGDSFVSENYVLGFKQITEIAVRAMSPGTNDPGTAITAIDHLTQLFARRLRFDNQEVHYDEDGEPRTIISVVTFSDLMYPLMAALRLYCKHDIVIVLKLLQMFDYLLQQPVEEKVFKETLKRELEILVADAEASIENDADRAALNEKVKSIRKCLSD